MSATPASRARGSATTPSSAKTPPPPITYEYHPGAASAPLANTYRRREPEKTVLYGVVREHLETFLEQARRHDEEGYPRFVEHEFRRYLDCGVLAAASPGCGAPNVAMSVW